MRKEKKMIKHQGTQSIKKKELEVNVGKLVFKNSLLFKPHLPIHRQDARVDLVKIFIHLCELFRHSVEFLEDLQALAILVAGFGGGIHFFSLFAGRCLV